MLFVLCIAAPLLSILYPLFGGSIAAVLTGIQTVSQSPVLQELLRTCGGPGDMERQALDGYCTSQLAAAP